MTDPAQQIGRRLKAARQRAHVSQAELAARLEVTQTAVSYWEAGRRLPGVDDLMKIAEFLDAPLTDLLPGDSERRPLGAVLRLPQIRFRMRRSEGRWSGSRNRLLGFRLRTRI